MQAASRALLNKRTFPVPEAIYLGWSRRPVDRAATAKPNPVRALKPTRETGGSASPCL